MHGHSISRGPGLGVATTNGSGLPNPGPLEYNFIVINHNQSLIFYPWELDC